jgi:asparaginyl-tRNA synthetase
MIYTYIDKLDQYVGKEITLKGWLYNKRSSGKIIFLILRDGTGYLQCVIAKGDVPPETFEAAREATQESSLEITGTIKEEKRAVGGYEMNVTGLSIIQKAEPYPITKKEHGVDFLMDHRHLWLRSKKLRAALKIRSEVIRIAREFYHQNGFVLIDSPILTPTICEGSSTLFETEYFDSKAFLAQSGQLYLEPAIMAFGKVYCFGPTFRAEKTKTRRHLQEFWMLEPEVAFAGHEENMQLAEQSIEYIVQQAVACCSAELDFLERDTGKLASVKAPFPRIDYGDAVRLLQEKGSKIQWGEDFGAPEETMIAEDFDRPVMIHRYPLDLKAFYMKTDPDDERLTLSVDVIAPEGYGEIIGGSQREDDHDILLEKLHRFKLPVEAFQWYLDIRKYGSVPHAGFGMGLERVIAWICGVPHLRETIPYPRMLYRLYP